MSIVPAVPISAATPAASQIQNVVLGLILVTSGAKAKVKLRARLTLTLATRAAAPTTNVR